MSNFALLGGYISLHCTRSSPVPKPHLHDQQFWASGSKLAIRLFSMANHSVLLMITVLILFESDIAPYNVTFLEGDLHSSNCGKSQA